MMIFWDAFLPNLVATVLGVILGLPAALYVNRRLTDHQRALLQREMTKRRNDSATVLADACEYNIKVLDRIKELTTNAKVMRNLDLRSTTWDAVNPLFSPLCADPMLLQKLSHHWLRLQRLERLNEEIFDREVGAKALIPDQELALRMWGELYGLAANLSAHAAELIDDLDKLSRKRLDASELDA